jgi:UDP-N-acetylglucosamine--N-acetylmuramyl-(pentapeptide) pyrophosphoryl-undecaprenol N-acetylglucosamine transferase
VPVDRSPLSVVVAGGGTAGHIEPALALADAVKRLRPDARVTALGTARGLETTLVPKRGYALELVPPVPLPRKPSKDLLALPWRILRSVRRTRQVLKAVDADVVVGFGGYVALPAYLAARMPGTRMPVVVHEANASAGIANKVGARHAAAVAAAVPGSGLDARVIGMPLRRSITTLDREALRAKARAHFGLDPQAPTLLVFGGSQGARSLNEAVAGASGALARAGIGVLHAHGPKNTVTGDAAQRSSTTVYALPVVSHGGGEIVEDADLTAERVAELVVPLLTSGERLSAMSVAARRTGHADADETLARMVLDAVAGSGGDER